MMMLLLEMRLGTDTLVYWRRRNGKKWGAQQPAGRRHRTRDSASGQCSAAYVGSRGTRGLHAWTGEMPRSLFVNQQGARIVGLKVTDGTTARNWVIYG